MINRSIDVDIDISATELADEFSELDDYEKAVFFERLNFLLENSKGKIEQSIVSATRTMRPGGASAMKLIGKCAEEY